MRGRKPEPLVLNAKDQKALQQLLRDGQTPLRVARRAQILLSCAEAGQRVMVVSDKVDQNRTTVWRVCERYRDEGLASALYDAPRAGHPRVFSRKRTPRY
jgi:saccharopine dehydrogenase-like NADP-dependent oxidoreductase